jgi:hypothetical protein
LNHNNDVSKTLTRLCLILLLISNFLSPVLVFGQTSIEEDTVVTATVPDNEGPTTPILISPSNNSYVTTNKPTFVWRASTDASGISHYIMSLDGSTLFGSIPTSATDNSEYTLTYNAINTEYSLTPKTGLAEGSHTWKIRAVDGTGTGTDSATWTFTIDTQSPSFVLTQIGDASVSISAQDVSTIPTSPVELGANSPLLTATGEANSSVAVTLVIPGDPTQNFSVAIDGSGNWSLQLGILPRDVVMTLNFTITDQAGNVSVLNGVEFIIPTPVIIIPPTPTPTPSPTPDPEASPTPTPDPGATPLPTPEATPIPGAIVIPVIPPDEILNELLQETLEILPEPLADFLREAPEIITEAVINTAKTVAPVGAAVATAAAPTIGIFSLLSQLGQDFSWKVLLRLLQALGLLPKKRPQGLVFNSQTNEPVAFALLTFKNIADDTNQPIVETVVSDVYGIYQGLSLPTGRYSIAVSHQDYSFPTLKPRPSYLSFLEFYKGETFSVTSETKEQLFLIPVDPREEATTTKRSWKAVWKILAARFNLSDLVWPLFIFSLAIAVFFPSWVNWLIVAMYVFILTRRFLLNNRVPTVAGLVTDSSNQPLPNAIVRLSLAESNQVVQLLMTDEKGEFKAYVPRDVYQINVVKQGYVWAREQAATLSFEQVDNRQETPYLAITLTPAEDIYTDLFGPTATQS